MKSEDKDTSQAMEHSLNNPVIVRKILQHFSTKELLELSFVNKLWNYEARSEIKLRGNVIATLGNYKKCTCQEDFEAFKEVIRQSNVVMFSGIHIDLHYFYHDLPCPTSATMEIDTILDRLLLKDVSVRLHHTWWEYKDCPALMLAKKILQFYSQDIEQLSLDVWSGREHFLQTVLNDCNFPRLKVLKLKETIDEGLERYVNYMKAIVSLAPNLQEVHCDWTSSSILKVMEGTSAVLVLPRKVWAPFNEIPDNVMSALRLEKVELMYNRSNFDFDRFNRITPMLLQTCCTTNLRSMSVDEVFALPLMCFEPCLRNVKEFCMRVDYRKLRRNEPRVLNIIQNFDFTRIFPSLSKVEIVSYSSVLGLPAEVNGFVEQANAILRQPLPDRAVRIKQLRLRRDVAHLPMGFLAEMFPSIEELRLDTDNGNEISLASISTHWVNLKKLEIGRKVVHSAGNIESFICGIFPEEVADLRQKDEEFLKRVNIVAIMPSITCLRNLRHFTMNYCSDYNVHTDRYSTTSMLSKVTALVAFARCPHLAVNLRTSCRDFYEELSHLKSYMSVVHIDYEP